MTRVGWENEEILDQFRQWLTRTGEEIEALDEGMSDSDESAGDPLPEVGLLQVAEALTAMRHELKLETRGARDLRDAVQAALEGLEAAERRMESLRASEEESVRKAVAAVIEDLVTLDESLGRGAKAFTHTHRQMTESVPRRLQAAIDEEFAKLPWWRRRLVAGWHHAVRREATEAFADTTEREFATLMQGFGLIRSRVEQALKRHSVRRVECVGGPVDPSRMSVVELVDDPDLEPETVVEEIRPGYLWHDRVIRFAEVRAVASQSSR